MIPHPPDHSRIPKPSNRPTTDRVFGLPLLDHDSETARKLEELRARESENTADWDMRKQIRAIEQETRRAMNETELRKRRDNGPER